MLPIEAGTHCVGGSIDDQAAPLSRRSRAKRRIHTEQFCSRNLIVTPDVSLHAQRARHASAPATRRAARAAGERSAAVQGSGRAAAAGSAGRQADARSDAAGCGPATFLRRAAAKVAASMGWSASISRRSAGRLSWPSPSTRVAPARWPPADAAVFMARIDLACNAPTEHPDHRELISGPAVRRCPRRAPFPRNYRTPSRRPDRRG
jgi:pyruvate/2-oxoglutarate dehydrogenase complex dihydrolipoamide acyltransferase (E2) component